jgi:signal transduction histidine kinase
MNTKRRSFTSQSRMRPARLVLAGAAFLLVARLCHAQDSSNWRVFQPADGLATLPCSFVTVSSLGKVVVTHPGSAFISELDGYAITNIPGPVGLSGPVYESPAGQLWTMTAEGLQELRDNAWVLHPVRELGIDPISNTNLSLTHIPLLPVRQGHLLMLVADRLFQFTSEPADRPRIEVLRNAAQSQIGAFSGMIPARDGGVWISGSQGLAKVPGPLRNVTSEITWHEYLPPASLGLGRFLKPQEDTEGGITMLGQSLTNIDEQLVVRFDGQTWTSLKARSEKIMGAGRTPDGTIWAVTSDALLQWDPARSEFAEHTDLRPHHFFDFAIEASGTFWLATAEGLFRHGSPIWQPAASLRGTGSPTRSLTGDQQGRSWFIEENALRLVQGDQHREFPLPAASVGVQSPKIFSAQNGDIWFGADLGTALFHAGKWQYFISSDNSAPSRPVAFAQLPDGKMWCAARDRIWEFDGKHWLNLRRGFDGINALAPTRDGSVWVASDTGLFRYFNGAWVENGPEEGLPSARILDLWEDKTDRLWASTAKGLALYYPKADADPPSTAILPFPGQEKTVRDGAAITISFAGVDKWKFTPRSRLLFSYRLDAGEWSIFEALDHVTLSGMLPGKHVFQVRAMDRNCNVDPKPAALEFAVVLPWYREARLVLISTIGFVVALFFAGLAFNRHRQLRRSYAEIEIKIAERTAELDKANRELFHSQKMNALGSLAAGIAHDFNNILSIIKGSAQIIEENIENPGKIQTRLDRIKTVVEQGSSIVKAMLGFSREANPSASSCDLNSAIEDTLKLLGDRFLREVRVSFEPAVALPRVAGSSDFIQQILLNLIFNAAESMSASKHILLDARQCEDLPKNLVLLPGRAAGYVCLSVTDSGCGISPEVLPRIFEPFFTTKALSARRGTGLGLSMVYELAKKLGAGIAVESAVGRGTTFSIILPAGKIRSEDSGNNFEQCQPNDKLNLEPARTP